MGDKKYKDKHRELGLCTDCSEPAMKDNTRCINHRWSRRKSDREHYKKVAEERRKQRKVKYEEMKAERLCVDCAKPLREDETSIRCFNCYIRNEGRYV